jgi:hypothetical protein
LSFFGIRPKKKVIWVGGYESPDGALWDIDSDGNGHLSRPLVETTSDGKRTFKVRSNIEAKRIVAGLKKRPHKEVVVREEVKKIPAPQPSFGFRLDENISKLATKMCIGLMRYFDLSQEACLSHSLAFLRGNPIGQVPVRLDFRDYPLFHIDSSPIAHNVYVEADKKDGKTYGVVQFFSSLQLFCQLGYGNVARSFSVAASLNAVSLEERFAHSETLGLVLPFRIISKNEYEKGLMSWASNLKNAIKEQTGKETEWKIEPNFD